MAQWYQKTIRDIIDLLDNGEIVLPVIQRELVWSKDKMIALFQTLLKQDSFGGIMTVKDPRCEEREKLFKCRRFEKNYISGNIYPSQDNPSCRSDIIYIIDGQQRLSSFFIGLTGSYDSEYLFFDLLGDCEKNEFELAFAKNIESLPPKTYNYEDDNERKTLWISVQKLFKSGKEGIDDYKQTKNIIKNLELSDEEKECVRYNLSRFASVIFKETCIGLCEVTVDMSESPIFNRLRIVRLFQKLNQGGTILSGIELMRSVLKAYNPTHENFLINIGSRYRDLNLNQDDIIRFVFMLQDDPQKDIADIVDKDSSFIDNNEIRIFACLDALKNFLTRTGLIAYFSNYHPSSVPLTLIAYFFFHKKSLSVEQLREYAGSDIQSSDFHAIRHWLLLSMLNHVFQRGYGWDPNRTGRKKIFEILSQNKNRTFPKEAIINLYKKHLRVFNPEIINDEYHINWYERSLVLYLMYGKDVRFRQNDIDHIHSKYHLEGAGIEPQFINSVCNYQWLFYRDNRSKQEMEFGEWLLSIPKEADRNDFLEKHLIPKEKEYWYSPRFMDFLDKRREIIINRINREMGIVTT